MSESTLSPIFAAAALLAAAVSLITCVGVFSEPAFRLRALVRDFAPWAKVVVTGSAMAASLYYSEVVGFVPCEFCWYQRIAMYPLVFVTLIAALTRDQGAARYVVPLAAVGLLLSTYHYQLQMFPDQPTMCAPDAPCTTRYVNQFGFVSIPFMAGSGFFSVLMLQLAESRARTHIDE